MATTPTPTPPPRRRVRVILFNGWLRTYTYPRLWMLPLAQHLRAASYEGAAVEVAGNTMPAQTNDVEKYVRHLADLVGSGGPDEDTYFIGQSVGCQVILRYLAQLPPGSKVCTLRWMDLLKGFGAFANWLARLWVDLS